MSDFQVYDDPDGVMLPQSLAESGKVVWKRFNDETLTDKIVCGASILTRPSKLLI